LSKADLLAPAVVGMANGSISQQITVGVNVGLGGRSGLVRVGITPAGSTPLLGIDVLKRWGSYTVDTRRSVLVLN